MKLVVEGFGSQLNGYDWFVRGELRTTKRQASDDLRELKAQMKDLGVVKKQRDELLDLLRSVASIAHCGGMAKMSESDSLTEIRRATLPHFDKSATEEQHRSAIASTPESALSDVRRAEREKCAILCEKSDRYRGDYFAAKIRAMGDE